MTSRGSLLHPSAWRGSAEQQPVGARGGAAGRPAGPALGSGETPGLGMEAMAGCDGMEGAPGGLSLIRFQKRDCLKPVCPNNAWEEQFLAFWDAQSLS